MDTASPLWGICGFEKIRDRLINCRAKSRLPENAKAVITACFPYYLGEEVYRGSNISKYAVVTDYHDVAINRLEKACEALREIYPDNRFVPFADNSPIPEVSAAIYSGLGVRGKNSLLITEKYGSFVFIGEIVTDLDLERYDFSPKNCIGCNLCKSACPAKAISESGIDTEKCLSAVTQKKGDLTHDETALMKECGCVWGCDICQDVCPMNKNVAVTDISEFLADPIPLLTKETQLDGRAFAWRGKKVTERNLAVTGYED